MRDLPVLAHGNEYREESPEPIIGPIICPKEKEEAMRLLSELTEASASSSHACIMSSITGVIDMDSPTPKITSATSACPILSVPR